MKEGSGDLTYSKLFAQNAMIVKTSGTTAKLAWPAISACTAIKVLLNNKFKISNLIGRAQFSGAETTRYMRGHQTPLSF